MYRHLNAMDVHHRALYERIQQFSLDLPEAKLSFSKRLARENGWSLGYTHQVVEEYKKFAFLAVAAGHPVTPSDQVDQVWHLHLSYTRSYWEDFCPNILQTPLHHQPTNGGTSEKLKFDDWYGKTLESYAQFFDQAPPISIWPAPKERFGRDLHFLRVNTQQNWVVHKPSLSSGVKKIVSRQSVLLTLFTGLTLGATGCQPIINFPNLLDLKGPEFLSFFVGLMAVTGILAFLLRNFLRLPSDSPTPGSLHLSIYEKAYLANGKQRVVETAIASLVQQKYVRVLPEEQKLAVIKTGENVSDPTEQAVLDVIALDGNLKPIYAEISSVTDAIRDRLQQQHLIVSPKQSFDARVFPALMVAGCLGLGILKIWVGVSRDKPVGYLSFLCTVAMIATAYFAVTPIHRSQYGDRILQELRSGVQRSSALKQTDSQIPLACALLGITALPPEMFPDFKKVFAPVSNGDGGSGDGGGGCGGGGCGGCGGCGG